MKRMIAAMMAILLLMMVIPASALAVGELPKSEGPEKTVKNEEAIPQEVSATDGREKVEETVEDPVRLANSGTVSGRLGLAKPTMDELRERLASIPEITELVPGYQPYFTGEEQYFPRVLSEEAYANGLAWINYFRMAAGLGEVTLTDELNLSAAWGALWLLMGEPGYGIMSEEDDLKGYYSAAHSNISLSWGDWGIYSLGDAVFGQMEDRDEEMISTVGHRRWLLDPRTRTMGIGSFSEGEYYITDIRVFGDDVSTENVTDYDFISWPASGNNISDLFYRGDPWSITLNPDRYAAPDRSKVQVTLTRKSDGKVWTFNKDTNYEYFGEENDFFNVNNDGYGVSNCIIFKPYTDSLYSHDGEYTVDVTGITDRSGKAASLHYSVLFEPYRVPRFKTQNLVLSGQIGVNFFMDLSDFSENECVGDYMEFTISGKGGTTTTDWFDPNHRNASGKYYGFTCYVKSIQMAETITATFHYGEGQTISKTYSVEEYFQAFEEHASAFDQKTTDLIHAIADYGHYMQIYLADVNHFVIGTDYAESSRYYATGYDYADVLSKVEEHAIARDLEGSKVEKANYRLQLGSETTLDVFLKTTDGSAPTNVKVTIKEMVSGKTTEKAYTPVQQDDGRYLITIPNISAHKLGDTVTITGTAGESFSVAVSPLSFVRDVLTYNTDTESKDGLCSLYAYFAATVAYKQQ